MRAQQEQALHESEQGQRRHRFRLDFGKTCIIAGMTWKSDDDADVHVDARGLECPEPLVRARLALKQMRAGQVVEVWATDPLAALDLEALCARTGDLYLGARADPEGQRLRIRKADIKP